MARRLVLAIAGGIALVVLVAWRGGRAPAHRLPPRATLPGATDVARVAPAPAPTLAGQRAAPPPAGLPTSLEGSEPDGAIAADAAGHLIVDIELRRLFDYFLAATGEEPVATIRDRIIATLRQRLPELAASEAIAILDRYLAYREAVRQSTPARDPAAELDRLHDLRQQMFSPDVAKAFFADEEAAIYAAFARRDALLDPALSPAERDRRIADLDARLPPAVRAARAAATAPIDQMKRDAAMRAAGATDQDITAARTAALGAEAAARLAELDRARAAWQARLDAFRAQRAALLADPALDPAERQRRVDDLLARSFTSQERIRVEALDRIAAHGGK